MYLLCNLDKLVICFQYQYRWHCSHKSYITQIATTSYVQTLTNNKSFIKVTERVRDRVLRRLTLLSGNLRTGWFRTGRANTGAPKISQCRVWLMSWSGACSAFVSKIYGAGLGLGLRNLFNPKPLNRPPFRARPSTSIKWLMFATFVQRPPRAAPQRLYTTLARLKRFNSQCIYIAELHKTHLFSTAWLIIQMITTLPRTQHGNLRFNISGGEISACFYTSSECG